MNSFTIEQYIQLFDNQETILIKSKNMKYDIVKENGTSIAYFDNNDVVFKVSSNFSFFALKCFTNKFDINNSIYNKDDLKYIANIESQEHEIDFLNNLNKPETTKILIAPWVEDVDFNNCNTQYIKQLHDQKSNVIYEKRRTKFKVSVLTLLATFLILISSVKFMYPNQIYTNPIDYKKLIAADSIQTITIAMNKNKYLRDSLINIKSDASGKSIFIKENANEVLSILVPEPIKKDKPKIILPKVEKKIAPVPVKKNQVIKKENQVDEKEIKVIHSKSKVNFKSTEF